MAEVFFGWYLYVWGDFMFLCWILYSIVVGVFFVSEIPFQGIQIPAKPNKEINLLYFHSLLLWQRLEFTNKLLNENTTQKPKKKLFFYGFFISFVLWFFFIVFLWLLFFDNFPIIKQTFLAFVLKNHSIFYFKFNNV